MVTRGSLRVWVNCSQCLFCRFYMDLESEENVEKDEFFEECLSDPTLRDQMSILTRKFKNKMQVI